MKILFTTHHLVRLEGSEKHTIELATSLIKQGHEVYIFALQLGDLSTELVRAGIRLTNDLRTWTNIQFDIAHCQHNITAIMTRSIFPDLPMVFMSLGVIPFLEQPPSININISKYLAISEEVQNNLIKNYHINPDSICIVRNHVDTDQYFPDKPVNQKLQNVLVISNRMSDQEKNLIKEVCQNNNLNFTKIGLPECLSTDVAKYINQSDLVISLGKGVLESMACGRNVIVYDIHGSDGFVDMESYPEIRKNNFSGRRYANKINQTDLNHLFKQYDPNLGIKLRELVQKNHSLASHIDILEEIYHQTINQAKTNSNQLLAGSLYPEIFWLEENIINLASALNQANTLHQTISQLQLENNNLKNQVRQLNNQLCESNTKLSSIQKSTSWKLTKPLRTIADLGRGSQDSQPKS